MIAPRFEPALSHSSLELVHQGKTRDTFVATNERRKKLLVVATDRLSTHNVIHESTVPYKGPVLTALTIFWIKLLEARGVPHHLVAAGKDIYDHLPGGRRNYPDDLHHRAIVVKNLTMLPIEFVWRGYLCGSLYKKYHSKGLPDPYGLDLESGLPLMTKFLPVIFTPTDKSETDEPLLAREVKTRYLRAWSVTNITYDIVQRHLNSCGLELVDSKFEVGVDERGTATIADEIGTPDSSRFCFLHELKEGTEPPWLDKQLARNEAERIWGEEEKVPLTFDSEIVKRVSNTYLKVFELITKQRLRDYQRVWLD